MAVNTKRRSRRAVPTRVPKAHAARRPRRPMSGDLFVHPDASTVTDVIDESVGQQIDALPFVRTPKNDKKDGRCFWAAKPTGNYQKDYYQGRLWARSVLPLLRYNVGAVLLSWIVLDMIKAGKHEHNGLVLGFVREIGDQLKATRSNLLLAAIATTPKPPAGHRKGWLELREIWNEGRLRVARTMANAI
jgi:hypothetical protein